LLPLQAEPSEGDDGEGRRGSGTRHGAAG